MFTLLINTVINYITFEIAIFSSFFLIIFSGLRLVGRLTRRQNNGSHFEKRSPLENFVDLNLLPPELALQVRFFYNF